jgi:hypothetical protein
VPASVSTADQRLTRLTGLLGFAAMFYCRFTKPQFFLDRSMRYGPSLTEEGEVVQQRESEFGPI